MPPIRVGLVDDTSWYVPSAGAPPGLSLQGLPAYLSGLFSFSGQNTPYGIST